MLFNKTSINFERLIIAKPNLSNVVFEPLFQFVKVLCCIMGRLTVCHNFYARKTWFS